MTLHLAISFVTPAMLGAAALVALPIAAHLLHRRVKRSVVFPSVELLLETRASQSSLLRLRRWLLLMLRCLAVLLLVGAFARPLLNAEPKATAHHDQAATFVLVVDRSASTQQIVGGVSAMQSLRVAAGVEFDAMVTGLDRVQVVWADAAPEAAFAQPTTNHALVRQELERTEPTHERANLRGAISLAGRVLAEADGARRLVVISDLQASHWGEIDAAAFASLPADASVAVPSFEAAAAGNATLASLQTEPALPVVGQPLIVTAEVRNHTPISRRIEVRLEVEGRPHSRRDVSVEPWSSGQAVFRIDPRRPGSLELMAAIPDDALAIDNARHAVVEVVDRLPVLLASDDRPDEPGAASFFLTRSLAPRGNARDRYRIVHRTLSEAAYEDLRDYAMVVVGSMDSAPSDDAVKAIGRYLRGGGSVLWFAADDGSLEPLARLATRHRNDSPADTEDASNTGTRSPIAVPAEFTAGGTRRLGEGNWQHPLLSRYGNRVRLALERVTFAPGSRMQPGEEAEVLLRFDDGSAAMVSGRVGEGRLVAARFSPALEHSDIATHGVFVTLMQGLAADLRPQRSTRRGTLAGQTLLLRAAEADRAGPSPRVLGPSGEPRTDALVRGDAAVTATLSRPGEPGIYRFAQAGESLARAAVNVDAREGDLRRIEPAVIRQRLEQAGARVSMTSDRTDPRPLRGTPIWGVLAALAAAALGLEMALTAWWRR